MLLVISIPIAATLFLCCYMTYLIASPFRILGAWISGGDEKKLVEQMKDENGDAIALQSGTIDQIGRYAMPAEGAVTSPFGMRMHPIKKKMLLHRGIDIDTEWHCAIQAIGDGNVVSVSSNKDAGYFVKIRHDTYGETIESVYCHLSEIYVIQGQDVKMGDVIAREGGDPVLDPYPGSSTGHHLHFEIHDFWGTAVDPEPFLFDPPPTPTPKPSPSASPGVGAGGATTGTTAGSSTPSTPVPAATSSTTTSTTATKSR